MNMAIIRKRLPALLAVGLLGLVLQAGQQVVIAAIVPSSPSASESRPEKLLAASGATQVYLPFIMGGVTPITPALVGVYAPGTYWGSSSDVNQYLKGLDSWAGLNRSVGKGHSIAGDFKDIQDPNPAYNIPQVLETLWTNGYTGFINMTTNTYTSAQIANGCCDAAIRAWAQAYAGWVAKGGNRRAFLAPLQEMNGNWTSYGNPLDPPNFKLAYARIQTIFANAGITRNQVWGVFAPNGWSTPPYHIAAYYPGDANVDIVAFSSYNQSYATAWMNPDQVFGPYIQEIRTTVTSSKPIFIAQTATCSAGGNKDQWLRDAYTYLVNQQIRGIIYFNGDKECDWAVYQPWSGGRQVQGYKDAVSGPNSRYVAPATLAVTPLLP